MVYKKVYRGFNFWLLLSVIDQYGSPFSLTSKQVKELGGHVLKGKKGFPVVFWKILEKEGKDGSTEQILLIRYYTVFNLKQTEGIDKSKILGIKGRGLYPGTPIQPKPAVTEK